MDAPITSRALISVSNKAGLTELGRSLVDLGIEILSSGGTFRSLSEQGIPALEVSDYTGFPEMMGGRIKTLHPKIHGGILGRRGIDETVMEEYAIKKIDLVIVNLYPFETTVAQTGCSIEEAVEQIDIGGPAMLRAAAKNYSGVGVLVDPSDYYSVVEELRKNAGVLSDATRFRLALKAFHHTAAYDTAIATYLERIQNEGPFSDPLVLRFRYTQEMRYGENPHQSAAFYVEPDASRGSIATAKSLQGKALSYNNIVDADAALECVKHFLNEYPTCVIVKHANPCGVAVGSTLCEAYQRAYLTDPTSAFGGIIAFNQTLDSHTARVIIEQQFVEVILAPYVMTEALTVLAEKPNVRVLETGEWSLLPVPERDYKRVTGGLLVQDKDIGQIDTSVLKVVTRRVPTDNEMSDLLFAWKVCKFVKSNAIVYAKNQQTIGIGAGQMSRVYSARIAAIKAQDAGLVVAGSVVASDAFFPFRDGVDSAAQVGVTALIQPGGSVRDSEVIAAADEHHLTMVFTGMRHFRH